MASVVKLPNIINQEPIKNSTEPNKRSFDRLPDIYKTSTSNIKYASTVSINNNNRNNLYSHGNNSIGLHDSNFQNEHGNKVNIKDKTVVPGTMEPKHSTNPSAIHGLLPKHKQDSGISLTSSDHNQQDNNMEEKQYLQENYDEWFLPDQYADYKAEKMKDLTKSLMEMTKKDSESVKSSSSFVIDATDTTPEEEDYLQSVQKELGSKEIKKKKDVKHKGEPSKNLDDVEDRVARLMEYLNKHVPDEDTETVVDQDVTKSSTSLVKNKEHASSSQNVEKTQSKSQEMLHGLDGRDQSKTSTLFQTNSTELNLSSTRQTQSSVKSDIKVLSNVSKDSSQIARNERIVATQKTQPTVRRKPIKTNLPNITQTRSVHLQRQRKTENTEQKKTNVKKKEKERNYFKPIPAPAIPPVRYAKSHLPKSPTTTSNTTTSNTAKSTPIKPKRYSPKLSRRPKKPVVREPPTTIRYPSRSERERQLRESEELMSARSISLPSIISTEDQKGDDDVFKTTGDNHIMDNLESHQSDKVSEESSNNPSKSENFPSVSDVPSTSKDPYQNPVPSTSVALSTSKDLSQSEQRIMSPSQPTEEPSMLVHPGELGTSKDSENSEDPEQTEASSEELKAMETVLKISEKCFVRKSKPNVRRSP